MNDLATRLAMATGAVELGQVIEEYLRGTFDPLSLRVFVRHGNGVLTAIGDRAPADLAALPVDGGPYANLIRHGRVWRGSDHPADDSSRAGRAPLEAECLAPILDRREDLVGLLVLGPRRSGEPYSDQDASRLVSVADHAGTAIEIIRLAEHLA